MFIADFHIHSKYSRATSRDCIPETLALWARRKGLDLIGTGDFTHPAWRAELRDKLCPHGNGLYALARGDGGPLFIISGEISSIYKKDGRVRKVHNLILLPCLEAAETLSRRLEAVGNLHSDGRPILGLDSRDLLEITLEACPEAILIPAHIWTPHFSLFGAYSGFDDIRACFGDLTGHIHALETGLSSDPPMNRRLSALDGFTLVSNSDAHSPANLAREANLFDTELTYAHIARALASPGSGELYGTIEFFPEEGKYHLDGHRRCNARLTPAETRSLAGVCPVCGGRITTGVLHRVEELADRPEDYAPPAGARYERLVPLHEVIASSLGIGPSSVKVKAQYLAMISALGSELHILREAPLEDIARKAGPLIAEGVRRLREGRVSIEPGYDGEYGKISIIGKAEIDAILGQISMLADAHEASASSAVAAAPPEASPAAAVRHPEAADVSARSAAPSPDGLNAGQRDAVTATEAAVAVIAGPGTGKTKTLVSRIAHLIVERGVPPQRITAVTFTNKAAGEMRARLEAQLGRRVARHMTIGTFHSICLKQLAEQDGGQPPSVITEAEALSIMGDVLNALNLKLPAREALGAVSLLKSGAVGDTRMPPGLYDAYRAQLEQLGALDFDDILLRALALAESADAPYACPAHLLVDEFQDINAVQYRLIKAWRKNRALFVIGDPDQAIYGFRGSDPRCFKRFFEDFPDARRITLADNYRSTPDILACAGAVMSRDTLNAHRGGGARVRLLDAQGEAAQARFIAREINRMVGGVDMLEAHAANGHSTGAGLYGLSDIAVLYRTNRQSEMLEQYLLREGIPYVAAGRGDYLSDPPVRRALAFFRLLLNPADRASFRVCAEAAVRAPGKRRSLLDMHAAVERRIDALTALLEQCRSVSDGVRLWLEQTRAYAARVHHEKPAELIERWMRDNGFTRERCAALLAATAAMHENMASFLQNLALGVEGDILRSGGGRYHPEAVRLMTLHAAKGLEFPVVFLCGLDEGLIPYTGRGGAADTDEERRLFYVGVTRARDELVLLTSGRPSPFLAALSGKFIERQPAFERAQRAPATQLSFF